MAWVKLDDGFPRNPKVQAVDTRGFALYVCALCWSSANLTDGHIPMSALRALAADARIAPRSVQRVCTQLAAAGLFTPNGDGWMIHDYLDYNPSRSRTLEQREANRKRQAKHRNPEW